MTTLLHFSLISLALAAPIPDEGKFTGEAENIRIYFNSLLDASKKVNDPKEKASARSKIEGALDWDRIAMDCMGNFWQRANATQRKEFRDTLKDVVTLTAFSRLDKFWDGATPRFEAIEIKGGEAHLAARFYFATENFTLDYYVNRKGAKWLIHDFAYEEVHYSSNIRDQIVAFLKEKSIPELLAKLRKRKEELKKLS